MTIPVGGDASGPRGVMPRVVELRDCTPGVDVDDFFRDFEASLAALPAKEKAFHQLERLLGELDTAAWVDLKTRAVPMLRQWEPGRGWQALFDVLNEAKAFAYLKFIGCSEICFIPRRTSKTPDLQAIAGGRLVLCEVKTLNISEREAGHRARVSQGHLEVTGVATKVSGGFLGKLEATLGSAMRQIVAYPGADQARQIVFLNVHFDDWVGDFQSEYMAQIDTWLGHHAPPGAETVVCPAANLFLRTFTMTAATVWELCYCQPSTPPPAVD